MAKENKKRLSIGAKAVIVIVFLFLCGIVGYLFGRLAGFFERTGRTDGLLNILKILTGYGVPVLYPVVMIILLGFCGFRYARAKHIFSTLHEDDEEKLMELERSLNFPMTLLTLCLILNLMFFSIFVEVTEFGTVWEAYGDGIFIGMIIFFLAVYAVLFILTRQCVELVKKINPEKRGDVLDFNFQKKWEESCDEAQKVILYQAGFKAYKVTNYVCMGVYFVCLIAQLLFHAGVMPILAVSAIWLIMTAVFCAEGARLEK